MKLPLFCLLFLFSSSCWGGLVTSTEYPFIARLFIPIPGTNTGNLCTGSLLKNNLILTSKQCFVKNGVLYPHGTATFNDYSREIRDKDEFTVNMKLVKYYHGSDLALAKLTQGVNGISPVRITEKNVTHGTSVRTVGYGMQGYEGHLRDMDLKVSYVRGNWIGTKMGKNFEGPCGGDGAPLLVRESGDWAVVASLQGGGYDCRTNTINSVQPDHTWNSVRVIGSGDLQ